MTHCLRLTVNKTRARVPRSAWLEQSTCETVTETTQQGHCRQTDSSFLKMFVSRTDPGRWQPKKAGLRGDLKNWWILSWNFTDDVFKTTWKSISFTSEYCDALAYNYLWRSHPSGIWILQRILDAWPRCVQSFFRLRVCICKWNKGRFLMDSRSKNKTKQSSLPRHLQMFSLYQAPKKAHISGLKVLVSEGD